MGGPIGPGQPTVLIGGMPAARIGDKAVCIGPIDAIAQGESTVLIGGKPAARQGDRTNHGGVVLVGCPTVLIGKKAGGGGGEDCMARAAEAGVPFVDKQPDEGDIPANADVFNEENMDGLVDASFDGADSAELNEAMTILAHEPTAAQEEAALAQIAEIRGLDQDTVASQYARFLALQDQADRIGAANGKESVPPLSQTYHRDFMGSTPQLRFGKVVGDAFGIDPVFGALLSPTGGLVGPGNAGYVPDTDSAVGYHGAVHDAAGYIYNYHNAGPGYDYLRRGDGPPDSPLSGQISGIGYWNNKVRGDGYVDTAAELGRVGLDLGTEVVVDGGIALYEGAKKVKSGIDAGIDAVGEGLDYVDRKLADGVSAVGEASNKLIENTLESIDDLFD